MQATKATLAEAIPGPKQFVIPVFQRDYSWRPEQWDRMWADVIASGSDPEHPFFLGSIVYVDERVAPNFGRWLVIDGQQRLTTLTLLMIALRDHLDETGLPDPRMSIEEIDESFLKNRHRTGDERYRLALRRRDNHTLRHLIDGMAFPEGFVSSEGIVGAYEHFRKLLRKGTVDLAVVRDGVYAFVVVQVVLERPADNPQLIFESLNSTGLALALSDLVRNYLLMGLASDEQTALYQNYWSLLEDVFRDAGGGFEEFLRDYMALEQGSANQVVSGRIYAEFKRFASVGSYQDTLELLQSMERIGRYYAHFLGPALVPNAELSEALSFARSGGFGTVHAALVARLYDYYELGRMNMAEFKEAMVLIKSYLVRRAVLGLQTARHWNFFARVALSLDQSNVFESLKAELAREKGAYAFPRDEEFAAGLYQRDLYHLRTCRHILDTLENHRESEQSPVGQYSIEHIMPQDIDSAEGWKEALGENWQEIHQEWLHRLGNLTLVGYDRNSSMSNRAFLKKLHHPLGFDTSAVRLNQYVRKQSTWTAKQMSERATELARRAVEIWPYPDADVTLVQDKDVADLREIAARRATDSLSMGPHTQGIYQALESAIGTLGGNIRTVETRSVSFYDESGIFFAELIPMASSVRALLPIPFEEVDDPGGIAADANRWTWIPNAVHDECGVVVDVSQHEQIDFTVRMVAQVYQESER